MSDLRDHLFEALEMVKSDDMTIEKARGICDIAQTIINTAKVEVDFIRAMGGVKGSEFMQLENGKSNSKKQIASE